MTVVRWFPFHHFASFSAAVSAMWRAILPRRSRALAETRSLCRRSKCLKWPCKEEIMEKWHFNGISMGTLSLLKLKSWPSNYINGPSSKARWDWLRVIPTLTHYSDIVSGIYSGILSGIVSDILSDIHSDILFDILSGILSGVTFLLTFCVTYVLTFYLAGVRD